MNCNTPAELAVAQRLLASSLYAMRMNDDEARGDADSAGEQDSSGKG